MFRSMAFCSLALMSFASLGSAADFGGNPSTPDPEVTWTGFYVGLGAGMGSLNTSIFAQPGPGMAGDPEAAGASASFTGLGADGGFFQLNAGADYQVNRWAVVGGFFDFDFVNMGSELNIVLPGAPFEAHASLELAHKWSIGARAGYLASAGTLLFVSAGYTRVNMNDLHLTVVGPDPGVVATVEVPNFGGAFVGGGVETKLTERISLRGEYRYTDFGSGRLGLPTVDGTNLNEMVSAKASPNMQDERVSVNYRF